LFHARGSPLPSRFAFNGRLFDMPSAPGFSLLESMLAVAVAAVLASVAVPSFSTLVHDTRRATALNAFVGSVQLARSEAIKRVEEVVLCKSPSGGDCDPAGEWEPGWLVFVNADRDSPPTVDANERILHRGAALPAARVGANRDAFAFRPHDQAATNGTVVFCDARGAGHARAVIISPSGRPRVSATDASGGPLACPGS
jgi:type IV fimbrial biogenesis protein FimT